MNYVNLNGELIASDRLLFGVKNRAFRYGDGLFETIRIINGKPLFLEDHLDRLYNGMRLLKMDIPESLHIYHLENQIQKLLTRCRINLGGKLRLAVFRADGGLYTPNTNEVSYLLEVEEMANDFALNPHGIDIGLYGDHLKSVNLLSSLKSSNSLLYVLAGEYAKTQKYGEAILLNEWKNLCEGISSNLFLVIKNKLYTPALQQGCIPGIMRARMIELAGALDIEVIESNISPEALMMADEVFFSNAIQGNKWAIAYGDKRYFASTSRKLCQALNEWAHELTKQE